MKVKRGGVKGKFGGAGRKEVGNCSKIQKSDNLPGNLDPFIASIYMKSRKILKEGIQVVCCPCYGKGEHPTREVVKMAKVTTRGHEGSPQVHSLCLYCRRDPQPESQETPKSPSSFSLVGSLFRLSQCTWQARTSFFSLSPF